MGNFIVPQGHTEQEVIDTLYRVARRMAYKFRFAYNDPEDIIQEGVVKGIEGLEKYEPGRPLENFLHVHIFNRLFNYKRDNYVRPNKPCLKCPVGAWRKSDDTCLEFELREDCEPYREWKQRNEAKKNIMDTLCYTQVRSEGEDGMECTSSDAVDSLYVREQLDKIRGGLTFDSLANLQRLSHGIAIPKVERQALLAEISGILGVEILELEEFAGGSAG